jgi:hypothetical protein
MRNILSHIAKVSASADTGNAVMSLRGRAFVLVRAPSFIGRPLQGRISLRRKGTRNIVCRAGRNNSGATQREGWLQETASTTCERGEGVVR